MEPMKIETDKNGMERKWNNSWNEMGKMEQ